jgi:hypothetical protein
MKKLQEAFKMFRIKFSEMNLENQSQQDIKGEGLLKILARFNFLKKIKRNN